MKKPEEFKTYDRVVCTNDVYNIGKGPHVVTGVSSAGFLYLRGYPKTKAFYPQDFKATVNPGFKVGDTVRVVDHTYILKAGATHKITHIHPSGRKVCVKGLHGTYLAQRFEKFNAKEASIKQIETALVEHFESKDAMNSDPIVDIAEDAARSIIQQPTNGTDLNDAPSFFSEDMLQPFQRVVDGSGEHFIVCDNVSGGKKLVFVGRSKWFSDFDNEEYVKAVRYVYEPPCSNVSMLDPVAKGRLIWARKPPKTPREIAIEKLEQNIQEIAAQMQQHQQDLQNLREMKD